MPFFERDRIRFHYHVLGEGHPLILTHGLGGDHTPMESLFGELEGFQKILWDCRGHGKTEPVGPEGAYSFGVFAQDLAGLLDHLGITGGAAVGISMGAGISARLAATRPDLVSALVLIRPAWLDRPGPETLEIFRTIARLLEELGPEEGLWEFEKLPSAQGIREESEDVYQSLRNQFLQSGARERRVRLDRMPLSAPIRDWRDAENIRAPTLVIGTDRDPVHPWGYAEEWARRIPNARLLRVVSKTEDLDRHNREVRAAVADFLASLA